MNQNIDRIYPIITLIDNFQGSQSLEGGDIIYQLSLRIDGPRIMQYYLVLILHGIKIPVAHITVMLDLSLIIRLRG